MAGMGGRNSTIVSRRRDQREFRRVFAPLACMVALFIAVMLMLPAISMTRGDLVCGIEEHSHGNDCYEQVLVCGLEEGEGADPETGEGGHVHAKECYEKQLTCNIPEHSHADACYAPAPSVSDDSGDVDENTSNRSDSDANAEESADESPAERLDNNDLDSDSESEDSSPKQQDIPEVSSGMLAQSFTATLKDKTGKVVMTVTVEAPEGAFPAGAFMKVDGVAADTIWDQIAEGIQKDKKLAVAFGEHAVIDAITQMTAVSIAFTDAAGNKLDAAKKCTVRITADEVRQLGNPVLVRTVLDKATQKAVSGKVLHKVKRVNADETDTSTGHEDTLKFKAAEFTTFAIVGLDTAVPASVDADEANDESDGEALDDDGESEAAEEESEPDKSAEAADPDSDAKIETVDFHYGADGKEYDFGIPKGGFVSLEHVLEVVGASEEGASPSGDGGAAAEANENGKESHGKAEGKASGAREMSGASKASDAGKASGAGEASGAGKAAKDAIKLNNAPVSEATKQFVAGVEDVEFSDPDLVWVGKVDEESTVGGLKEANGLESDYNANLADVQVAEIDAQTLDAGDWALISLQPFATEETMTVTMDNGDQFTVRIADTQISKTYVTAEGDTYRVTVTYGENAQIPDGAELEVSEIVEGEAYEDLNEQAQLLLDVPSISFSRIFDINIVFAGQKVEPAAGVEVKIEYIDGNHPEEADGVSIVHFADDGPEVLSASTDTNDEGVMEVSFSTESLSPFATVSERIDDSSISDSVIAFFNFDELDGTRFVSTVNGITSYATPIVAGATPNLSPAYDGSILKLENSNNDALNVMKSDGTSLMTGLTQATVSYWEYTTNDDNASWAYYAAPNGNNQPLQGGEQYIGALHRYGNLTEERYYNGRGDGNYQIVTPASGGAWHYVTVVYDTNTTTVYVDGAQKGSKSGQPALNDILGNNSIFQIGKANWGTGEYFTGYLDEMMIMNRALTADEVASLYNSGYAQGVTPQKQNKIGITELINYAIANGVDTVTDEGATVPEGSYRTTRAGKVLNDVIFYATEYDHGECGYDYYAVTHDGGLAKVTDLGSEIMWKDPRDIKWDLIVYTNTVPVEDGPDQVVPTGYYELAYTDADGTTHYLAPQLNTTSLVQGEPLGLQFAGPSVGDYGTTIEAWDADDIEYVGLQIHDEGLTALLGRASEAFFFARNTQQEDYTNPRPVATVDSASKGVQISMFDYNGSLNGVRPEWMQTLIGDGVYRSGHQVTLDLVKHNLVNGVPVASLTNNALTELFGGTSQHVDSKQSNLNHLFLQGTYDETGFFSYNSAQNYAYYNNDSSFIVYDQAAAPIGTGSANYHGNFFPYNTFDQASTTQHMWYDVNDALLTPDDPEYGTALLSLNNINYSFGMEIETNFYMTKTGLDERGKDIVYEFNGDDDLWVFVDDMLALDIGGVHGAIHGMINFTTGEIFVASENKYSVTGESSTLNTTVPGEVHTTLAEQFRKAYQEQGKSDAEITALLDSTFNKENGQYTSLKAFDAHNLKMFYMESGMGASNLNVRFNMPVVPPKTFTIEKDVAETAQSDYTDQRFAFKVYVQDGYNSTNYTQVTQVGSGQLVTKAVYEGTETDAAFEDGIFYLRPDEAIQLTVDDERLNYYVEEVQIDPNMWDSVNINNGQAAMVADGDGGKLKVVSDTQQVVQRSRVLFDNVPKNVQKLLINKVVESDDPQSVDPNLTYEFYVYLEGHSGNLEPYRVGEYYLTKTVNGAKHYFNNQYTDLGTEPTICSYSGEYGAIGNIRAGYTIEIPGLLPGTDFYVVERMNRIPDGYIFVRKDLTDGSYAEADSGVFLVQDGGNTPPDGKIKANADAEVTVVNGNVKVNLVKVDATNMTTPIQKAKFTLKKLDPEGYGTYPSSPSEQFEKTSGNTDAEGKTHISGIKNGYYEISESTVPAGYIQIDDGKFYIRVQNGIITLLAKDTAKKVKEWPQRTLTDQDKLQFDPETGTFTVGNTPGTALPHTGGSGTVPLYFVGIALMALAMVGLLVKPRRRHE